MRRILVRIFLVTVLLTPLNLVFVQSGHATDKCGLGPIVSSDCTNFYFTSPGIYTIQEGVTISDPDKVYAAIASNQTGITLKNSGAITSAGPGALLITNSAFTGGIWNTTTGVMQDTDVWAGLGIAFSSMISGGLLNQGQILSNSGSALTLYDHASVDVITNLGVISSNTGDHDLEIGYYSTVGTLNNFEGTNGSGGHALRIKGSLPNFYNMIAYGDQYGQLSVLPNTDPTSPLGTLSFGIFAGDPWSAP